MKNLTAIQKADVVEMLEDVKEKMYEIVETLNQVYRITGDENMRAYLTQQIECHLEEGSVMSRDQKIEDYIAEYSDLTNDEEDEDDDDEEDED